jgi:hypothetical protein
MAERLLDASFRAEIAIEADPWLRIDRYLKEFMRQSDNKLNFYQKYSVEIRNNLKVCQNAIQFEEQTDFEIAFNIMDSDYRMLENATNFFRDMVEGIGVLVNLYVVRPHIISTLRSIANMIYNLTQFSTFCFKLQSAVDAKITFIEII